MRIACAAALALVVGKLPSCPTHPRQQTQCHRCRRNPHPRRHPLSRSSPSLLLCFSALFRRLLRLSPYRYCFAARCVIPAQAGIHVFLLTTCCAIAHAYTNPCTANKSHPKKHEKPCGRKQKRTHWCPFLFCFCLHICTPVERAAQLSLSIALACSRFKRGRLSGYTLHVAAKESLARITRLPPHLLAYAAT